MGVVAGILISLCMLVSRYMIDRVAAPIFAQGLDGGESGPACGICILSYLIIAVIFMLAGAATVAWCGKLISCADEAIKTAAFAGAVASVLCYVILIITIFPQQMHDNSRIFAQSPAYMVVSLAILAIEGIVIGVIYMSIGAFCAFVGGDLYYLARRKKGIDRGN